MSPARPSQPVGWDRLIHLNVWTGNSTVDQIDAFKLLGTGAPDRIRVDSPIVYSSSGSHRIGVGTRALNYLPGGRILPASPILRGAPTLPGGALYSSGRMARYPHQGGVSGDGHRRLLHLQLPARHQLRAYFTGDTMAMEAAATWAAGAAPGLEAVVQVAALGAAEVTADFRCPSAPATIV